MPDGSESGQEDAGYEAEDAKIASAGEPSRMTEGLAREQRQGPTARELDARDERFGRRKPMGPTAGMVAPTVPEGITPAEEPEKPEKPRARKRKGDK
jgi:hypothetical protein